MAKLAIEVSLIEKIIRELKNDNTVRVIDVNTKSIGAKGDNYTSEVSRIMIEYLVGEDGHEIQEEISLFLKQMHASDAKGLSSTLGNIFRNEMSVLAGPLRRMRDILGIPGMAKLFYSHVEEPYFAIMEDLIPLGFSLANRATGLDLQHTLVAVRHLAKFHASSVAVYEENPEYKTQFLYHLYQSPDDATAKFLDNAIKALAIEISEWPEVEPKYVKKVKNLQNVIFAKTYKGFAPRDNEFTVLTHGDCSQLNMLFAYDEEKKPERVALVDFQFACYNSPAVDLRYFFASSVAPDVQKHEYSLLEEYHAVLLETMKHFNCKTTAPSLEELRKMYDDRIFVRVMASCLIEPIMHTEPTNVVSIDALLSDETGNMRTLYRGDNFRKLLAARLEEYDKLGLLDA